MGHTVHIWDLSSSASPPQSRSMQRLTAPMTARSCPFACHLFPPGLPLGLDWGHCLQKPKCPEGSSSQPSVHYGEGDSLFLDGLRFRSTFSETFVSLQTRDPSLSRVTVIPKVRYTTGLLKMPLWKLSSRSLSDRWSEPEGQLWLEANYWIRRTNLSVFSISSVRTR